MSWIVQYLIKNSLQLKSKHDVDSDEYNNLLLMERKIEILDSHRVISSLEMNILNLFRNGCIPKEVAQILGLNRDTVAGIFIKICDKISFYLGGEFTDDGYITYMQEKYNLKEEEVEKLKKYMTGNLKHKLIRTIKR
jgi:hypothetical protein